MMSLVNNTKVVSVAIASASGVATLAQTFFMAGEEGAASGLFQNVIQIGAPVALGAAVANLLHNPTKPGEKAGSEYLMRLAIGGGVTVGILMLAGVITPGLDVGTLSLVALTGGSIVVGDMLALSFVE
jgi:hypothetical protein